MTRTQRKTIISLRASLLAQRHVIASGTRMVVPQTAGISEAPAPAFCLRGAAIACKRRLTERISSLYRNPHLDVPFATGSLPTFESRICSRLRPCRHGRVSDDTTYGAFCPKIIAASVEVKTACELNRNIYVQEQRVNKEQRLTSPEVLKS
jgi:hypothetical protein